MITVLPALLSPDQVATARRLLADASWEDGRDSAGPQARTVKNNHQLPHDCEAAGAVRALVLAAVEASPLFLSAALPLRIFTPRVNRYRGDANAYGAHVDNALRRKAVREGEPLYVRTDVSCTVFLSEPSEYDGGELAFAFGAGEQRVKLPAGHAVLNNGGAGSDDLMYPCVSPADVARRAAAAAARDGHAAAVPAPPARRDARNHRPHGHVPQPPSDVVRNLRRRERSRNVHAPAPPAPRPEHPGRP